MRTLLLGVAGLCVLACKDATEVGVINAPVALTTNTVLDLSLGTSDSLLIGRLGHATRMPDGTIVGIDADAQQLVRLDSAGRLLDRVGRAGAGPGEFDNPSWVGRCNGDSLFVWDPGQARISVFAPSGAFARQFKSPVAQPFRMTCNDTGTLAAFDASSVPLGPPRPGVEPAQLRGPLVIFNASGDTLGGVPGVRIGQSRVLGPLASLALRRDELIVGVSDSATFRRFDLRGIELARDTMPLTQQPMPAALYEAELDRMSGFAGAEGPMRARIREMLDATPRPANRPLYQAMFVSPDGTLWLVTSLLADSTTTVLGRTRSGQLQAIEIAETIEVYDIGDDYLLGRVRTAEGDERLVIYRFKRP